MTCIVLQKNVGNQTALPTIDFHCTLLKNLFEKLLQVLNNKDECRIYIFAELSL